MNWTVSYPIRTWDIKQLHDIGSLDRRVTLGNGSYFGAGTIGKETVQFTYDGKQGVYYAGSVNYALFGQICSMLYHTQVNPLTGAHDPSYSEAAAVLAVKLHKLFLGDWSTDYEQQAVAFTRFGFGGTDPSGTALTSIQNNTNNPASTNTFMWKFLGIRDDF